MSTKILSSVKTGEGDSSQPYIKEVLVKEETNYLWNPDFDQNVACDCGHPYERHFDSYEDNEAVGCKYCACGSWMLPVKKAGLIPYYYDHGLGDIKMLFMISSDPAFGGSKPQIAKGQVDSTDKGSLAAAVREAEEELGFKISNTPYQSIYDIYKVDDASIVTDHGAPKEYSFALYVVEINDKDDFNKPHFETEKTVWLTAEQFEVHGTEEHFELVKKAWVVIATNLGYSSKKLDK